MSGGHLISRPARLIPCHGCHRHILTAVESGITVAADLESLDLNAEIAARITGRATYDIITIGRLFYLVYRDVFRVPHRTSPVIAGHRCPAGAQPHYQLIPPKPRARKKTAAKAAVSKEDSCPF